VWVSVGIAQQSLLRGAYEPWKVCQSIAHAGGHFLFGGRQKLKRRGRIAHDRGIYREYACGVLGSCQTKVWAHICDFLCLGETRRPLATETESRLYATKRGGISSEDGVRVKGCCLPAIAAAASIAAALVATFLSWARFIHFKGTPTHLFFIQGLDCGISCGILHLYETETAKSAGFPIGDHSDAYDLTVLGKHFPNVLLSRRVGQVAYINTLGHLIGSLTDAPPYCVPRNRPGQF
jgi:hypothetical protein